MIISLYVSVLVALVLLPTVSLADDFLGVRFESCYDGDTCTFTIPYESPVFGRSIPVRLAGLDTPEIRGACEQEKQKALVAREAVTKMLEGATLIDLIGVGRDKYFRLVAIVLADGININHSLLASRLAVPYDGGAKPKDWCAP